MERLKSFKSPFVYETVVDDFGCVGLDPDSRGLVISTGTLYQWRKKYSGMEVSHLKRLKELETENSKLKRMYAEKAL